MVHIILQTNHLILIKNTHCAFKYVILKCVKLFCMSYNHSPIKSYLVCYVNWDCVIRFCTHAVYNI